MDVGVIVTRPGWKFRTPRRRVRVRIAPSIGRGFGDTQASWRRTCRGSPGGRKVRSGDGRSPASSAATACSLGDHAGAVVHGALLKMSCTSGPGIIRFRAATGGHEMRGNQQAYRGSAGEVRHSRVLFRIEQVFEYRPATTVTPFNFRICCSCVAGIVLLEQTPQRPARRRRVSADLASVLPSATHGACIVAC